MSGCVGTPMPTCSVWASSTASRSARHVRSSATRCSWPAGAQMSKSFHRWHLARRWSHASGRLVSDGGSSAG